jgi:hypothetical protein
MESSVCSLTNRPEKKKYLARYFSRPFPTITTTNTINTNTSITITIITIATITNPTLQAPLRVTTKKRWHIFPSVLLKWLK